MDSPSLVLSLWIAGIAILAAGIMLARSSNRFLAAALLFIGPAAAAAFYFTTVERRLRADVLVTALTSSAMVAGGVCAIIGLSRAWRGNGAARITASCLAIVGLFGCAFQWWKFHEGLLSSGHYTYDLTSAARSFTAPPVGGDSADLPAKRSLAAEKSPRSTVSPILGETMRNFFSGKKAEPPPSTPPVTLEDENFRFAPPGQWEVIDPKKINPIACYAIARFSEQQMLLIISERVAEAYVPDLEIIGKVATANLKAIGTPKLVKQEAFKLDGMNGLRMEHEITRGFTTLLTIHQIISHRGFVWQLVFQGRNSEAPRVRKVAGELLAGFTVLDKNRSAGGVQAEPAESAYTSPLGWSVDLKNQEGITWNRKWAELVNDYPSAEFGIMNDAGTVCLFGRSVWLPEPCERVEALAEAFLSHFDLPLNSPQISKQAPVQQGPARGIDLHFTREIDGGRHHYRARILQAGNRAWFFCGTAIEHAEKGREHLQAALERFKVEDAPKLPEVIEIGQQKGFATLCNDIALHFDRKGDLDQSIRWLKHANAANQTDPVILRNLMLVAARAGRPDEGLAVYERLGPSFPGNLKIKAEAARLTAQAGRRDEAIQEFTSLFEAGHRNDEDLASFIGLCRSAKDYKRALEFFERFAASKTTPSMRRMRALLLADNQREEEAIEVLLSLRKEEPDNAFTIYRLADILAGAGRHQEILAHTTEFLGKYPADADVLHYQGVAQLRLKQHEAAKNSFEAALRLEPASEDLKDLLGHASAMLGQGDNSQLKAPLDPVAIPAELLKAPAETPAEYVAGHSAYYRLAVRAVSLEKHEKDRIRIRTTEHRVVHVIDREGAESFNSLRFSFNPRGEDFYVNSLIARDERGEIVGVGKVEDYYVLDDSNGEIASNDRTAHTPVPGLRPGCTIEYTFTRVETVAAGETPFTRGVLSLGLPVLRSTFLLHDPDGLAQARATPGLKPARHGEMTAWSLDQPAPFTFEPLMAPWHTFSPMVTVGDPKARWSKLGELYLGMIKPLLEPDGSLDETVARLTAGAKTDAAKVRVLARHVQNELTYKAIEFGRRARIPQPVASILKNRFGDCKDHALLLHQLLRAAGVRSHFTLINSGGNLSPQFPSLDQFDHAIVYVPGVDGGLFVDCTQKSCAFESSPPDFAGYQALVLDPKDPALVKVRADRKAKLQLERDATPNGDGDLEMIEKVTAFDEFASDLRSSLRYRDRDSRRRAIEAMLKRAEPGLEVRDLEIENLTEPEKPLVLKVTSTARRKGQQVGSEFFIHVPATWEHAYLVSAPLQQRRTPFEVLAATEIDSTLNLRAPDGWRIPAHPGDSKRESLKHGTAEFTVRHANSTIERRARVTLNRGRYPAEDYAQYARDTESLTALCAPRISFEKQP